MELERAAVRQQLLHHDAHLLDIGPARGIGHAVDIVKLGGEPIRRTDDLLGMKLHTPKR